jgi:hypothetical protein
MTQPTEATIEASVVEPSAPAALMLTSAPGATLETVAGSSPAMMPATCVPCPKVSRWASRDRGLVGEVGACTTCLGGQRRDRDHARVDHRDVDARAGGARLVAPIARARRPATCRASRRRPRRPRRRRPSPCGVADHGHHAGARGRARAGGHLCDEPSTTSDCPTVPPLRSRRRAARPRAGRRSPRAWRPAPIRARSSSATAASAVTRRPPQQSPPTIVLAVPTDS